MSHKYLEKTMEPIDFKPAHEALHRFCEGKQKICIKFLVYVDLSVTYLTNKSTRM